MTTNQKIDPAFWAWRPHLVPAVLIVISVLIILAGDEADFWLRYQREEILAGQYWRILSGSLVHLGWPHLLMNLAGLVLIWLLFASTLTPRAWTAVVLCSGLGVGIGLLVFNPELDWYVGLSGVLHGMFIAGVIAGWRQGQRVDLVLLGFVIGKLAYEQWAGPLPGSATTAGGEVIVDAHLYGAISGLIAIPWLIRPVARSRP